MVYSSWEQIGSKIKLLLEDANQKLTAKAYYVQEVKRTK